MQGKGAGSELVCKMLVSPSTRTQSPEAKAVVLVVTYVVISCALELSSILYTKRVSQSCRVARAPSSRIVLQIYIVERKAAEATRQR